MNLDGALYVHIRTARARSAPHDEVLCRRCYEELKRRDLADDLRDNEVPHVIVEPWTGEARCALCEAT